MPKVTIRLELTNVFNELGHFANDNLDPQYNNALSIPAGNGFQGEVFSLGDRRFGLCL